MRLQNPFSCVLQRKEFVIPKIERSGRSFYYHFERVGELHSQRWSVDEYSVTFEEDGIHFRAERRVSAWRAFFDG